MSSRPRVVFVTSVFDEVVNGPGIYARYLWNAFQDDADIDFHLVAPRCRVSHPNVHSVEATGRNVMWEIQKRARQVVGERTCDSVVHGNSAYMMFQFCDFPGPWLAQVNDYEAGTVWSAATTIIRERGLRRFVSLAWRRRQELKAIRAARRIVCNSEYVRDTLMQHYQIQDPDRFDVIYKAVDTETFAWPNVLPDDPLPGRPRGARLLFVGNDWRRKGLRGLLEALPVVAKRIPNCQLTIAGPEVQQHDPIRRIANQLGVSDRIHLAGQVSRAELPALLWHSDLFVLPANAEAFGVSILEALAAGLPVVASDVGGIPEIIRRQDEGVLVPPSQSAKLASAICRTLDDEDTRRAARVSGPARAAEFAVEKMTARIKQVYMEVIEAERT